MPSTRGIRSEAVDDLIVQVIEPIGEALSEVGDRRGVVGAVEALEEELARSHQKLNSK
jgi:hypothetical protein